VSEDASVFDGFSPEIRRGIEDLGWKDPMPVQQRVIPLMLSGRDLIVQARTGSGKTGAFGLPIIAAIDPSVRAVQALVLEPTRELASQVAGEIRAMGRHAQVEALEIYGGVAYGPQLDGLRRGVQVVAGTPGRILDHLSSRRMDLSKLRTLIFDEADELLSLGFWPDMKELQRYLPAKRQSGLFSATIPERVRSLARTFLVEPEFVSLVEGGRRSPDEIEHYHTIVPAKGKEHLLLRILEHEDPDSAIIFCNTRDDVRFLTAFLKRHQQDADMIQGDMTQSAREQVMGRIKAGKLRYLVATDVAARGIDISDLSHVISYTAPDSPEVYLHRTGRTGRAGKTGTAISLVSGLDIGNFRSIQKVNQIVIPERPAPTEKDVAERLAQRVQVRIEHDLRELPERERQLREEQFLPVVQHLAASDEGLRDLAAVLHVYLRGAVPHPEPAEPRPQAPPAPPRSEAPEGGDDFTPDPGRRRRRRRRRPTGAAQG
jgi:ATP-dependent RNA helicase DeaD